MVNSPFQTMDSTVSINLTIKNPQPGKPSFYSRARYEGRASWGFEPPNETGLDIDVFKLEGTSPHVVVLAPDTYAADPTVWGRQGKRAVWSASLDTGTLTRR